jgi:hypothetical protein
MKKSIFLLMLLSAVLISCGQRLKRPTDQAIPSTFNLKKSITPELADKMIQHYNDKEVDHSPDAIIKQITLYNSDWYSILTASPNTTRIRLLTAAYLNNSSVPDTLRNRVTIIVQLKVGYNSEYFYYDINSFGDGRICPPPPGCSPNILKDL